MEASLNRFGKKQGTRNTLRDLQKNFPLFWIVLQRLHLGVGPPFWLHSNESVFHILRREVEK